MRLLAVLVLVIGFLVVWQVWPVDPDLEAVCPPFGETEGYTIEPVWWPPGASAARSATAPARRPTPGAST